MQASGDIYAVSKQVAVPHHYIADVHPDPKTQGMFLGEILVRLKKCMLHVYGTLNGIHGTGELAQNTFTSGVRDSSSVVCNETVHDLTVGSQGTERSNLIQAHKARITSHVSGKNRHQPSLNLMLLRTHWNPRCSS